MIRREKSFHESRDHHIETAVTMRQGREANKGHIALKNMGERREIGGI